MKKIRSQLPKMDRVVKMILAGEGVIAVLGVIVIVARLQKVIEY